MGSTLSDYLRHLGLELKKNLLFHFGINLIYKEIIALLFLIIIHILDFGLDVIAKTTGYDIMEVVSMYGHRVLSQMIYDIIVH